MPGIQPKRTTSWYVQWGGCDESEAQGVCVQIFKHMLQTWKSDLITLSLIFRWFADYPIFTSQVERKIYSNKWMNEKPWKYTCMSNVAMLRVSFPAWEDLLKFDTTAWISYHWSSLFTVQARRSSTHPPWFHGAKHLPSMNWTYRDTGLYSDKLRSYLNMSYNQTVVDTSVTTQSSYRLATLEPYRLR